MHFKSSPRPTLGVELEMALVDEQTMALSSSIQQVLSRVPEELRASVKPELMQCYLEINTDICNTVDDAATDLREKIRVVQTICDDLGLRLYWTGTHPFSRWQDQKHTPDERYAKLMNILQDVGRQLVTFGLHVHVGVDSGDKAVMICDRIMRYLPALLAVSGNSPWWNNRVSGLHSHRSKIMEGLPTAGLPSLMRNWSEYVWLVNHLIETGFINSIRDIWWDVRPHHNFGTVEVRVCDMPGRLDDAMAIAALVHCLVFALSEDIDQGAYQHDCHPMMVRQNKWRAARYGLDAELIDTVTHQKVPARLVLTNMVERLRDTAKQLRCEAHLDRFLELVGQPTWAGRQLAALKETGDAALVIRRMTELSRV
jgi:carboxylate-amine ligase